MEVNIDLINKLHQIPIRDSEQVYRIMRLVLIQEEIIQTQQEYFWTVALAPSGQLLNIELVSVGTYNRTLADPVEIFSIPLQKKARMIFLVHNHPGNSLEPSDNDIDTTNLLIQAGRILNTEVADHIIITEDSYYSFKQSGLLEKLRMDTKYIIPLTQKKQLDEVTAKLQKEARKRQKEIAKTSALLGEKKGLAKGAKAEKMEIAKNLFKQGVDLSVIKQATGLSAQWLGRLKSEIEATQQQ